MFNEIKIDLASLVIYRGILDHPVIKCLKEISESLSKPLSENAAVMEQLSRLAYCLWDIEMSYQDLLLDMIFYDDNPFSRAAENWGPESGQDELTGAVRADLIRLYRIYNVDIVGIAQQQGMELVLPKSQSDSRWGSAEIGEIFRTSANWPDLIENLRKHYAGNSRGLIARCRALTWDPDSGLKAVKQPDPIRLSDLIGYKTQIQQVCDNTEKLLKGLPANHILLHGPRGTGKSSIIKALLNEYGDQGLHLVEINRDNLQQLDRLVELLQNYSACFIIFMDDLSFEDNETQYKGFKAVLEGSLTARPRNVLVYATSNRRHLIREFFADRQLVDEEIHSQETMQEKLSLADRFGLSISFPPPSSQLYIEMVEKLAGEAGINMDQELLRRRALEWERLRHGPSGRVARQFVDSLEQRYYQK